MKKLLSLLGVSLTLMFVSSCSSMENKISLAMNVNALLTDLDNQYAAPEVDKISANLEINAGFAVYFTNTGCSSCETFSPIMDEYLIKSKALIYKFDESQDREALNELSEKYKDLFFKNGELSLPALAIVNNKEVEYVNRDSYMKTQNAFFNYMNSHYKVGNVSYTQGDVFNIDFINREFAYVYFDFSNQSLRELYKSKLEERVKSSKRKVIVSNYVEDGKLHLKLCGKSTKGRYSRLEFVVTSETNSETISKVL